MKHLFHYKTKRGFISFQHDPVTGWHTSPNFWRRYHSPGFWRPTPTMFACKLFNYVLFVSRN